MIALDIPDSLTIPAAVSPPRASAALRLRRRDPSVADGFVDGGWWPRSLDLSAELPRLLAELSSAGHDVAQVIYNPTAWKPAPRTLAGPGRPVTLDPSTGQDAASISLVDSSGSKRTDLVVVPPRTDRRIAERVLALAGLGGDLCRAVGIIERANGGPATPSGDAGPLDPLSAAAWETDGGRILAR
jgi:hypothetical protein